MRWDNLFDDLESQLEQELGAEEVDLLAEEERLRLGRLTVRDRVTAMTSPGEGAVEQLRFALRGGELLTVAVGSVGRDWLAGELVGTRRGSCVLPLAAIASLLPTAEQLARSMTVDAAAEVPVSLSARLGLTFVLRDLCRRRAAVELSTASEGVLHGTIDRVGRDHLDLAEHAPGEARRAAAVSRIRILPLSELLLARF
ncbi:MAG TPA: hypothetical protein VGM70_03505 [Pseudolysinimonas sp.]|jgi:hypothetical protein